jgi:hypothetical protein
MPLEAPVMTTVGEEVLLSCMSGSPEVDDMGELY